MPISTKAVLQMMERDLDSSLVIEPFFSNLKTARETASLDFHLGNRFTFLEARRKSQHSPLNKETDVASREIFLPMGHQFSLHPGQVLLGTTLEWFRFPMDLMAYVIGRSSWGRRYLLIVTASAVHPGSSGIITLELANLSRYAITLMPGIKIGQLFFHRVDPPLAPEH